jgi:hypothetical protein
MDRADRCGVVLSKQNLIQDEAFDLDKALLTTPNWGMAHPKPEVWHEVDVHLELAQEFDPAELERLAPGTTLIFAELLIGPPRQLRQAAELWPYAGLKSFQSHLPRLRFYRWEARRLAQALDRLFTTMEFELIGHRVLSIPALQPSREGWRALSRIWLCYQPLAE